MTDNATVSNFRSPVMAEPVLMPPTMGGGDMGIPSTLAPNAVLRTPVGNVRPLAPPPLPMAPTSQYSSGYGSCGGFGNTYGSYGTGYGGFNSSYAGYGGFGSYGGFGGFSRFGLGAGGMNPMDPEARFIQLAEASSRPAFQSIESIVLAIGNIASMLDSTFFALTSSFRAILGVAANFGRLRGVFAQFWSTFVIFRGLTWIYRKILYWLKISDIDPSSEKFKKAFAEAMNETSTQQGAPKVPRKGQSPWPVIAFLSFIFTAPYLIMKLLGTVSSTAQEEARDPSKWVQPIESAALYDFQSRNPSELPLKAGQRVVIAPKEIQNTVALLNTGWAMATIDGQKTGIIPINYVKSPQQMRQEQLSKPAMDVHHTTQQQNSSATTLNVPITNTGAPEPNLINLSTTAFAPPPKNSQAEDSNIPNFDIAPQPIGPPSTVDVALQNEF